MRRWGVFFGLLVVALARPQAMSADQKADVLNHVKEVLTETAFVPGISFDKWSEFIEARQDDLNSTDDIRRFVFVINRALREFGVSHINVSFKKRATEPIGGQALLDASTGTVPAQEVEWIDENTARLRLRTFGEDYNRSDIEKAFAEVSKADKLILDLRGNGGGAVSNLQHFLSLLLPPKTEVGTIVSRRIAKAFQVATHGDPSDGLAIAKWTDRKFRTGSLAMQPYKGKIAVLTSRGSASASEICAAALKEALDVPIVGSRTAGAVLVSRIIPLPDELEIKVPTADYYTPKYRRLEGNPLQPDAETDSRDTDACVKKAVELLSKG